MSAEAEDASFFDRWVENYDADVAASSDFPFAGYDDVHAQLVQLAQIEPGMSVLDLGTGTGNLAGLFLAEDCTVWATDSSPAMVARAQEKYPKVHFSVADLRAHPPPPFPERYERITSAYALHHFELEERTRLINDLVQKRLLPAGQLLVADVAFPTVRERDAARLRFADRWDASEHYWAVDETLDALDALPLEVSYAQVSFCAGIFVIRSTCG